MYTTGIFSKFFDIPIDQDVVMIKPKILCHGIVSIQVKYIQKLGMNVCDME